MTPPLYWVIYFIFDDDPSFLEAYDRAFYSKDEAIMYVNDNLQKFFPYVYPVEDKVKRYEVESIPTWKFSNERVEIRPQITQ